MALKGKQFLDQVSKKAVVICLAACLAGRKINGLSTARWGEVYALGCGSKTLDRRPVAAGVSPVGLSPDYHFNSGAVRYADGWRAIQQSTVIQLQNAEEELGLRPELTASIAHGCNPNGWWNLSATPLLQCQCVPPDTGSNHNRQQEFYQPGGIAGHTGWLMLRCYCCWHCLNQLSLSRVSLILGGRNRAITPVALSTCNETRCVVRSPISTASLSKLYP